VSERQRESVCERERERDLSHPFAKSRHAEFARDRKRCCNLCVCVCVCVYVCVCGGVCVRENGREVDREVCVCVCV